MTASLRSFSSCDFSARTDPSLDTLSMNFSHVGSLAVFSLNFIKFTTVTKQVIQLLLIMLVGTDICVRMVFMWEETGVPRGSPLV